MDNNLNTIKIPISTFKEDNLALFFDKPFEHTVRYIECVPPKYFKNTNIAAPVLRFRNILIIMTIIEIFSSLWGFSFYFIRRSMIYIVVNCTALLLSLLGIFSTIFINEIGLLLYTLVILLTFSYFT